MKHKTKKIIYISIIAIFMLPLVFFIGIFLFCTFYPLHKQYAFYDENENYYSTEISNGIQFNITYLEDDWRSKYYHARYPIDNTNNYIFEISAYIDDEMKNRKIIINDITFKGTDYIYPDKMVIDKGKSGYDKDKINYSKEMLSTFNLNGNKLSLLIDKQKLEKISAVDLEISYQFNSKEYIILKKLTKKYVWKTLSDEM